MNRMVVDVLENSLFLDTCEWNTWQGHSLSPMLFVLARVVLTQLFLKVQENSEISGFEANIRGSKTPTLQFIDDTLIFVDGEAKKQLVYKIFFSYLKRCLVWGLILQKPRFAGK